MITEEEGLERARELHPELADVDFDAEERQKGINWNLHLTFDAVVLRRMSDPGLPDGKAAEALARDGVQFLDAVHAVGRLISAVQFYLLHRAERGEALTEADTKAINADLEKHIALLADDWNRRDQLCEEFGQFMDENAKGFREKST